MLDDDNPQQPKQTAPTQTDTDDAPHSPMSSEQKMHRTLMDYCDEVKRVASSSTINGAEHATGGKQEITGLVRLLSNGCLCAQVYLIWKHSATT